MRHIITHKRLNSLCHRFRTKAHISKTNACGPKYALRLIDVKTPMLLITLNTIKFLNTGIIILVAKSI